MRKIVKIADEVAADLNGHGFGEAFTAVRSYHPTADLKDLRELRVTVVPKSEGLVLAGRDSDLVTYDVDIGVQKKLSAGTPGGSDAAEIDALLELVEEICQFLNRRGADGAVWVGTANDPIYMPEHLEQLRQFTSVITVSYRLLT